MSQSPLREYHGKRLIQNWLIKNNVDARFRSITDMVLVTPQDDLNELKNPFPEGTKLVGKPDQLIKRRGKLGLVKLNSEFDEVVAWVGEKRGQTVRIGSASDYLEYFLIEPFVPHDASEEHYICIHSLRDGDEILFCASGGVDVGDVDAKALKYKIRIGDKPLPHLLEGTLLMELPANKRELVANFIVALFQLYSEMHFAYLEINPLVVMNDCSAVYVLDLAAKVDTTAEFIVHQQWKEVGIDFPPYFGHRASPEEAFIHDLDDRTGASLKLTVLNENARIWTMVAGGGASVIYADTIADLGGADDLGNYGEYSGAPTKSLTYKYCMTILSLLLKYPNEQGKILIIGGGIANFTDVADTFKGIIQALEEKCEELLAANTEIFVRRGGPNYQEGLKLMRECGRRTGLNMKVFGPETHITAIVSMALGRHGGEDEAEQKRSQAMADVNAEALVDAADFSRYSWPEPPEDDGKESTAMYAMTTNTRAIVYGMQRRAVQNMLDFDYSCRRENQSVEAIVYTFASGEFHEQFYWGSKQIMLPVFPTLEEALAKFPLVDTIVNFASSRSSYSASLEMMNFPQIRHVTMIAEGVPERNTRELIRIADEKGVTILGPSTVGGLKPGCFRIGNTGGMLDNIVDCKLFRPGSVGFVSKSGGLSNELSNIISRGTDGVFEGMAIGGDRYPISTFMTNFLRYQADPNCKILVLLGEVGGTLEYEVTDAIERGIITKPVVAWCTGTCARCFPYEVQFGHAGAMAQSDRETAWAKNEALARAGCFVPDSFDNFGRVIHFLYERLVREGLLTPRREVEAPPIPVDYSWARKLGLVRKPAGIISGIADERGEELIYAGVSISEVFAQNLGVGGVVSLLWFRRQLPEYANRFIEMILMVTADHGPAVSGAHNTIVTARAGKDLVSSLCSGLLTIGPRFGGALDGAARMFRDAYDAGLSPMDFVSQTRAKKQLIMGIGHKIKSLENPDKRVEIIVEFAHSNFDATPILDYALEVQKVTTRKKSNLILNVDGAIACAFVDLMRGCGSFTHEEADAYVEKGALNALFVLGRSIGLTGHYLDQRRLNQGLYRHPTDDINYFLDDLA